MSRIFDALQRSGGQRNGEDSLELLNATEILRQAERNENRKRAEEAPVGTIDENVPEGVIGANIADALDFSRLRGTLGESAVRQAVASAGDGPTFKFPELHPGLEVQNDLVTLSEPDSPAAEAFRLLGVRLRDLRRTRPLSRILVTSTMPQEGKSTVSANLATVLARGNQKVLLVDGDVRRPGLSQLFNAVGHNGLFEWLEGKTSLADSIYRIEDCGIWFMPAGNSPNNPLEMLQSGKLNILMKQLCEMFDTVLVDSPPVLPLADTSIWMRLVEGILLVARQGTTEKKQLKRGLEALDTSKLIGALLNCATTASPGHYYYYKS